jgi:hypothetical protein
MLVLALVLVPVLVLVLVLVPVLVQVLVLVQVWARVDGRLTPFQLVAVVGQLPSKPPMQC